MASNYNLNIPEPTTPTKSMTSSTDNLTLASPTSVRSGSDSSMITTGGVPIATLKTPTKGMQNQNIAPKQPIMMSPPKLYIKVRIVQLLEVTVIFVRLTALIPPY